MNSFFIEVVLIVIIAKIIVIIPIIIFPPAASFATFPFEENPDEKQDNEYGTSRIQRVFEFFTGIRIHLKPDKNSCTAGNEEEQQCIQNPFEQTSPPFGHFSGIGSG